MGDGLLTMKRDGSVEVDAVEWAADRDAADRSLAALREIDSKMDTWATIPAAAMVEVHGDPPEPVPSVSDHLSLIHI